MLTACFDLLAASLHRSVGPAAHDSVLAFLIVSKALIQELTSIFTSIEKYKVEVNELCELKRQLDAISNARPHRILGLLLEWLYQITIPITCSD